jgi:hypothetical protein
VAHPAGLGAGGGAFAEVEVGARFALDGAAGVERHGQAAVAGEGAGQDRGVGVEPVEAAVAVERRVYGDGAAGRQRQPRSARRRLANWLDADAPILAGSGSPAAPAGGLPSSGARRKKT